MLVFVILVQTCIFSLAQPTMAISNVDNWTMFRHDPTHSGTITGIQCFNSAKLLWTHETNRAVQSSPAVANGLLVVGCRDTQVYCLNASTGEAIWQLPFRAEVWSSPAIDDNYVYVGVDDGYFYWINITDGSPLWRTFIGGTVRSSPAISDGCIYIGSGSNDLYCLNQTNGEVIWKAQTEYSIYSSPAISDGAVFFSCDDFYIWAVNATNGKEIWHTHTGSVLSSPSVYNNKVFVGSVDGFLYALNASTGEVIWRHETDSVVNSSPAIQYGRVYFGADDGNLYCLNASNGEKIWQSPTGYWITSSPAVAHGNVYVGSRDFNLYCFDLFTGEKKWCYETGNYIESSPTIVNNTLYFGSDDCKVYALTLCDSNISEPPTQINSIQWTTVLFDIIALTIFATSIISTIIIIREKYTNNQPTVKLNKPKQSWFFQHIDLFCLLTVLAFLASFYINIGSGPLWGADEQIYSEWAHHMVRTGDYLTPWSQGEINFWISKPPLNMWLMALSYQIFGFSNFASRFWSPIFSALSLIVVYYLGKKLYNPKAGFIAIFILGTFETFFSFARHSMTDAPFVFFILMSIYSVVLNEESTKPTKYMVIGGLFFGLALMTKQIEALLIPIIIFTYLIVTKKSLRFVFSKSFTLFWGIGLIVFSPWLIYMAFNYGSDFWSWYFMYSGIHRTLNPIEGHNGDIVFYISYLIFNENPFWISLLPFSAGLCLYRAVVKKAKADLLVILWILIVLSIFTFAQTKLYWYILPAFPAFALTIGNMFVWLSEKVQIKGNIKKPCSDLPFLSNDHIPT